MTFALAAAAAVVAFAYTVFLATFVASRIRPDIDEETGVVTEIPRQRPVIVAVVAAVVTGGLALTTSVPWVPFALAVCVSLFVVSGTIDAQTRRLPNVYSLHALGLTAVVAVVAAVTGAAGVLLPALIVGAATFILFLLLNILSRNGFGMGDVKLGGIMTFLLVALAAAGWTTSGYEILDNLLLVLLVLAWAFVSFFAGTGWILLTRALGKKDGIPFGPFMVGGWVITFLAAAPIHSALIPAV